MDALAELEKLRRQARQPKGAIRQTGTRPVLAATPPPNGRNEIRREVEFTLPKDVFRRAHRFSLTLQLEDQDQQAVDEARQVHVDITDAGSMEELLLRFHIALNTKT